MMRWYRRDGTPYPNQDEPIGSKLWDETHRKIEGDLANLKYKRVAATNLPDGYWVSTVWLGLDHGFSFLGEERKPVIFETMVFKKEGKKMHSSGDLDIQERYSTEEEAIEGHKRIVKECRRKILLTKKTP